MSSKCRELECLEDLPQAKKLKVDSDENEEVSEGLLLGSAVPGEASFIAISSPSAISRQLLDIEGTMCRKLMEIQFGPPITHIYNPLDYAAHTHSHFVNCYGNSIKKVLFVGMNPGPFGMAQNGVKYFRTNTIESEYSHTIHLIKDRIFQPPCKGYHWI